MPESAFYSLLLPETDQTENGVLLLFMIKSCPVTTPCNHLPFKERPDRKWITAASYDQELPYMYLTPSFILYLCKETDQADNGVLLSSMIRSCTVSKTNLIYGSL